MNKHFLRIRCCLVLVALCGCASPMQPERHSEESEGSHLVHGEFRLSKGSQASLGLEVEPVCEVESFVLMPASGWMMAAPGREVLVRAPSTGYLTPVQDEWPALGASLKADQKLAMLHAFVSPLEHVQLIQAKEEADIQIKQSKISMQLAREQLDRLSAAKEAVSGMRIAELTEAYARSRAAYEESLEKLPYLPDEPYGEEAGLKPVAIKSAIAGRVLSTHVVPRQLVMAGDPLWSVADWSTLWVRVPVFADDLSRLIPDAPATVTLFSSTAGKSWMARPVAAPQPTTIGRQTVDLYFEVSDASGALRPGQAVSLSLACGEKTIRRVVPGSSLLWDASGNAAVYVRKSADVFERRRVELGPRLDPGWSIARGLETGEQIVTVGAASLHSEEFKGAIPQDDD